ncbi:hypothetical protein [Micromonospora echinofusca]|uniref:Uncharacterized protein n=1 Tax=Micromonospora echinofusca TaxID=47858 RepID=A0ABS3VUQ2_MICEH|nr:hypothetical protein [Micromonospora echinofusca]MBO4208262.1 hypothetical protein [Micromonospora echinofusca]
MTEPDEPDALLLGGPRDGTLFVAEDAAVVQLELAGLMQRYLRTTGYQEHHGRSLRVYVYDGAGDPAGSGPGVSTG